MKTKILIILIVLSAINIFAQTDSLAFHKDVEELRSKITNLEKSFEELQKRKDNQVTKKDFKNLKRKLEAISFENSKILQENNSLKNSLIELKKKNAKLKSRFEIYSKNTKAKIDSLQQVINSNTANIKTTSNVLGIKIKKTRNFTDAGFKKLKKTISQNTLYWIIAIWVVALLVLLVYVFLKKQLFKQKTNLNNNLQKTRKALEEEAVKLDNKLIEILETQLKIMNSNISSKEEEQDHKLALKVADEIVRIQKNLSLMDQKTKGLKQLTAAVKRIQDNFAANGYEIVEMLGKPYNEGMKVSATFVPDENLEPGQQIITRIIKPQVNYKGVMIQSAQIEVSQG